MGKSVDSIPSLSSSQFLEKRIDKLPSLIPIQPWCNSLSDSNSVSGESIDAVPFLTTTPTRPLVKKLKQFLITPTQFLDKIIFLMWYRTFSDFERNWCNFFSNSDSVSGEKNWCNFFSNSDSDSGEKNWCYFFSNSDSVSGERNWCNFFSNSDSVSGEKNWCNFFSNSDSVSGEKNWCNLFSNSDSVSG
jgi:hypothetical protein